MALYVLSEASGLIHRPRDSVLRELLKVIEVRHPCQHGIYRESLDSTEAYKALVAADLDREINSLP
jgi:hypothetical protein